MTSLITSPLAIEPEQVDWYQQLQQLSYAYGEPDAQAILKATPEDFKVVEIMSIQASGEGEHYWLDVSKASGAKFGWKRIHIKKASSNLLSAVMLC